MARHRILVVDDDQAVRLALGDALALIGYSPTLACDAAEALAAARANPPDLIILDHMMWPMDGLRILDVLQGEPRLRPIPVVFLTAIPQNIPRRAGVAAVLGKPIRLEVLVECLRSLLDAPSAH